MERFWHLQVLILRLKLWSIDDYHLLNRKKHKGGMKSVAFSRDGLLASASNDGTYFLSGIFLILLVPPIQLSDNVLPRIVIHSPLDNSIFAHNDEIEISGIVIDSNQIVNVKIAVTNEDGGVLYSEDLQVLRNGIFRKVIPEVSELTRSLLTRNTKRVRMYPIKSSLLAKVHQIC